MNTQVMAVVVGSVDWIPFKAHQSRFFARCKASCRVSDFPSFEFGCGGGVVSMADGFRDAMGFDSTLVCVSNTFDSVSFDVVMES